MRWLNNRRAHRDFRYSRIRAVAPCQVSVSEIVNMSR